MRTLSLHIPFNLVYSCFVLFLVLTVLRSAARLHRLLRADPESGLEP